MISVGDGASSPGRHETRDADEVDRILNGQQLAKPSVSELLEARG